MVRVDDLVRLVPPPGVPVDADGDWTAVETTLGLRLPADYRVLIARYGLGTFDDILLWTPFTRHHASVNLLENARRLLKEHQEFRSRYPEEYPYPLYPERHGLLEWASTGNGDRLCWVTDGGPDDWPVLVWNIREGVYRYDMGAAEFLHAYLSGRLEVELLWRPPPKPWFDPLRERCHVYVKLTEGELPYEERLRILRVVLAPTADRGGVNPGNGARQDHFKVVDRDWLLTYETAYGHQIRVAFPPEDGEDARVAVLEAVEGMGCQVISERTIHGSSNWPRG